MVRSSTPFASCCRSLHHLRSPSAAFLAAALPLLSSSPATLWFAPYGKPFSAYCSYRGMWACTRSRVRSDLMKSFSLGSYAGMLVEPYLSAWKDLVSVAARAFGIARILRSSCHPVRCCTVSFSSRSRLCITTTAATSPFVHSWGWTPRVVQGGVRLLFPSIYTPVQRAY